MKIVGGINGGGGGGGWSLLGTFFPKKKLLFLFNLFLILFNFAEFYVETLVERTYTRMTPICSYYIMFTVMPALYKYLLPFRNY